MNFVGKIIEKFPPWCFTIVVGSVILWLTFGKIKVSSDSIFAFPHFDKIVHAVLLGMMFLAITLDIVRGHRKNYKNRWINGPLIWGFILASLIGGSIELLQPYFHRSCDLMDFIADEAGIIAVWIFIPFFLEKLGYMVFLKE